MTNRGPVMPKLTNVRIDLKVPGVGGISGTWEPDESEIMAAWELYVEMVTINLGNDRLVSVNDLIRAIEGAVGRVALVQHEERHRADPSLMWADIGRARRLLGWHPEAPIEEGIRRTVTSHLDNREWAKDLV